MGVQSGPKSFGSLIISFAKDVGMSERFVSLTKTEMIMIKIIIYWSEV